MSDAAFGREETRLLENRLGRLTIGLPARAGEAATAARVVYAGAAAYAALFVFAAVVHYLVFKTPRGDLGNMVQAVWSTTHGHVLGGTTPNGHQATRFQAHVDPFLLVFVPFLWIWSSPLLLLVVQALAVASGALPVFWLARKHLGSPRAGAHFAVAYLLYPATQYSTFTPADGFHSVAIAAPLVLYAIWFLDEERLVASSLVALLACSTREEIPLAVGCLGIWYAARKSHHRGFGVAVFTAGLTVTLFNFLWVIPHFSPSGADPFVGRYHSVGGTPQGMVHTLFSHPAAFGHAVASGHKLTYLALLLVPLLGLSLLEPLLLLGAVPDLAINLLSSSPGQTSIAYQYTAGIVPFAVAAAIFGARRLSRHREGISIAVLVATAAVAIVSPIYVLAADVPALASPLVSAKEKAVSLIPPEDPVSASNQLGSHLSERLYITVFPHVGRSHWIVVDVNENGPTVHDSAELKRDLRKYKTEKSWRIVFSSHGVTVLHKRLTRRSGAGK